MFDSAAAVATATKVRDLGQDPPADAYAGARALAQWGTVVEMDSKASQEERAKIVQVYSDRGMAMLRDTFAKGYKGANHEERLRSGRAEKSPGLHEFGE